MNRIRGGWVAVVVTTALVLAAMSPVAADGALAACPYEPLTDPEPESNAKVPNPALVTLETDHDLPVGVPGESVGQIAAAGGVNILDMGPGPIDRFFSQKHMAGTPEAGDQVGSAVTLGFFGADDPVDSLSYHDLAIGVPGEDWGSKVDAGGVNLLYSDRSEPRLHEPGVAGASEPDDRFGSALAAGDFDGDGFHDVAVGVPGEDWGTKVDAGAVNILHGSVTGITADGDQIWSQSSAGILGGAEPGDEFGAALAVGDFDCDTHADLVVGGPGEDWGTKKDSAAVHVIYGQPGGLAAAGNQMWTQNSPGVPGSVEAGDLFGAAVGVGDFNGDGYSDLIVGAPGEDVGAKKGAGAVTVIYGSALGLTASGAQGWHQDVAGIAGVAEATDEFGFAVAATDVGSEGYDDLIVGVPGEAIGNRHDAGAVNLIRGSSSGLRATGNQFLEQTGGADDHVSETGDRFGQSLFTYFSGDFVVGAPHENLTGLLDTGAVFFFNGSDGPIERRDVSMGFQSGGGSGPEPCDRFGTFAGGLGGGCSFEPLPAGALEFSPLQWDITLDSHGDGVHRIFMMAEATPMTGPQVDDLSGRLEWNETVIGMCNIDRRAQGFRRSVSPSGVVTETGYIRIGDGFQTNEDLGCGADPNAMQDAFDQFGLPEQACVVVKSAGVDHEYCAPLDIVE